MGFHILDLVVIIGIGLVILGPKTMQSLARNIGKGAGQAKDMKEKVLAELPMEEISKVSQQVSRIPLSPQQAVQMLLTSEPTKKAEPEKPAVAEKKAEPKAE